MEIDGRTLADGTELSAEVVVIGAGPAGLVTALELSAAGHDVLLVESGSRSFDASVQRLGNESELADPHHVPLSIATRRQIGGATTIWGGRCVPYDPIDFEMRSVTGGVPWPVRYDDVLPYFQRACDWFVCGRAIFDAQHDPALAGRTLVPGLPDEDVRTSSLERWSLPTNFGKVYLSDARKSRNLRLITNLTCTRIIKSGTGEAIERLELRALDGTRCWGVAQRYVLAAGGLESTRLLMASQIGNPDHLGRWYMAHVEGRLAKVRFTTPPSQTIYEHEVDGEGVYVRRRFSFTAELLASENATNMAAWLVNPEVADASHRSGVLSFVCLALSSPFGRFFASEAIRKSHLKTRNASSAREHLRNLMCDLPATLRFALGFGYRRFLKRGRRAPGFFTYSAANTYPLQYQGEHLPHSDSCLELSDEVDALGVPRLRTYLKFDDDDVRGVIDAHRRIDSYLRRHGVGYLEYDTDDLSKRVWEQLHGGYHQTGTTRMSARPQDGVVDGDLRVHEIANLHVVSSSTFPTSSHANSTFMIVVFALRLADHIHKELAPHRQVGEVTRGC